jgi:hypothetical protein
MPNDIVAAVTAIMLALGAILFGVVEAPANYRLHAPSPQMVRRLEAAAVDCGTCRRAVESAMDYTMSRGWPVPDPWLGGLAHSKLRRCLPLKRADDKEWYSSLGNSRGW